jgi:penicillin-binding protein 1C
MMTASIQPALSKLLSRLRLRRPRVLAAAGLVLLLAAIGFGRMLPSPLFDEPLASVLVARDGTLLSARIASDGQWRFPPLTQVPAKYRLAVLTYEDKRFEHHFGVDLLALARALRSNLTQGRTVSGASTITMQVARLARAAAEPEPQVPHERRGYGEKLLETLLALRLELAFSKEAILALYASHAPFGGNVVGLEAASWRYFGRAPQSLSWAEAATLAVLPNAPALVTPGRHRAALAAKRDRLLRRMHAAGMLSELDLKLALAEGLVEAPRPLPDSAPHLLDSLRSLQPQLTRFTTTLDASLQTAATELVAERAHALAPQQIHNIAALVVDNRSFEVLAYVGNSAWSARNDFSFAVDIVQRPRSTGSILKPFLYAGMLDAGQLLPHMLVADVPTQFAGYSPENFDHVYRGALPADQALAQSLNVPAVRELKEYGVERFSDLLRNLGMSTLRRPPQEYGLSLILGGAEATLWDLAGMYANLVDLARQVSPGPAAPYRDLTVLSRAAGARPGKVRRAEISPGAAWLTLQALLDAQRPEDEMHWRSFASSRNIAWKTGTSWGFRDAWAVGSTSRYTVAVWTGNANGEGRAGLTGAVAAAPLMFELQGRLDPAPWLTQPTLQMKQVEACADDGYLASPECEHRSEWVPVASHFGRQSPYHLLIHLDASGRYQVDSACERVSSMQHAPWFVLPAAEELYYRRRHAAYRPLPPWRPDCAHLQATAQERSPMDFLYPGAAGKIYIPVELDGSRGRTIFEAVHRDHEARLYWHLDGTYLGSTQTFHQMELDLAPGQHVVAIVDGQGNRLARSFEVLTRPRTAEHPTGLQGAPQ